MERANKKDGAFGHQMRLLYDKNPFIYSNRRGIYSYTLRDVKSKEERRERF